MPQRRTLLSLPRFSARLVSARLVPAWLAPARLTRLLAGLLLAGTLAACGHSDKKAAVPAGPPPSVSQLYNNGVDALNAHRYNSAIDQFEAVEQNYPYSTWAVNALLMQGYAQYLQNHYTEAVGTLNRFIQLHPTHHDVAYAYYLRALCYYEQIGDVQRDQKDTQVAMGALQEVVSRFPDTPYATDSRLKIDLCRDHMAGHEMSIGRWYEQQHLYTAAIGRFQRVVDDYQTTNHVPEALERLVEIYLKLGLKPEALRTAAVLGYNYPGNSWYAIAYGDLAEQHLVHDANGKALPKPSGGFFSRAWDWAF